MAETNEREEKTEDATPRRRAEAREQGQVALSQELTAAAMLALGLVLLAVFGGALSARVGGALARALGTLGTLGRDEVSPVEAAGWLRATLEQGAWAALCLIVPLFAAGLLVAYAQAGFQVTPKAIRWDPTRLDPAQGLQRLLGSRSLVRTLAAALKITLISAAIVAVAWSELPRIAALSGNELGPVLAGTGRALLSAGAAALGVIVVLALGDLAWQRFRHERDMRMSKKELKDELRNTEGDPHVRGRIRQLQREMARRRMMQEVPKATVVVTNPTHYAVALRYEREGEAEAGRRRRDAPHVVAKGVDRVALRIQEVAREHGVPCYEDVPLARALHAQVEIGEEVPERYYQAVAAVLAYVYRVQEERSAASPAP